jgi:hypothetical protein
MTRAILAVGVVLLTATCGASGGGAGSPAQPGQRAQPVNAQPVVRGEPVTVQAQPAAAPSSAPAQVQPVLPAPAPTSSGSSGGGSGAPIGDDGPNRPCPIGTNPPLHKMCPI